MGLRNRIFGRNAAPEADPSAPDAADAAGAAEPASPDEAPVPDDITIIRPPGDGTDQPTIVAPAAEQPQPAAPEPAPQGDPLTGHPAPEPVPDEPQPAAPEHEPQGDPVDPDVQPEAEAEAVAAPPEGAFVADPGAAARVPHRPGFRERGRLRRRLRYLREVRELGFRDLGGLVFDQHRFQRPNEQLVLGKVAAIDAVDREIRAIEAAIGRRSPYDELFVPGVSACPRCGALHGSDARFCPNCGLAFGGPRAVAGVAGDGYAAAPPPTAPGQAALFDPHAAPPPEPAPPAGAPQA